MTHANPTNADKCPIKWYAALETDGSIRSISLDHGSVFRHFGNKRWVIWKAFGPDILYLTDDGVGRYDDLMMFTSIEADWVCTLRGNGWRARCLYNDELVQIVYKGRVGLKVNVEEG